MLKFDFSYDVISCFVELASIYGNLMSVARIKVAIIILTIFSELSSSKITEALKFHSK